MADLVRIYASGDAFAAELMQARLRAEGIHVLAKGEGEGPYRAGPVYLFVPKEREADARALLDAIASGALADDVDAAFAEGAADDEDRD